jgi:hypothetical protein
MGLIAADAEGSAMGSEPYTIPPVGKTLPMPTWASIVTRRIRDRLPEVRAARVGDRIRWTYGGHVVTAEIDGAIRWVHFAKPTGAAAPRHPSVFTNRHDVFTAHCVAGTMLAFFSAEFCTPQSQRLCASA